MSVENPKTTYLKDYRVPDFIIDTVHLYVDIHDSYTMVKAVLHIQRHPDTQNKQASLSLMGEDLELQSVALDGKVLSSDAYEATEKSLIIPAVSDQFVLETCVKIFPDKNTQLMGLYQSRHNLCTQCESEGFRRITYYLDRPDVMARFTTTVTADKATYPFLLSNGNLVEEKNVV